MTIGRAREKAPALVLEGVTAGYCKCEPILRDVDLRVPQGACWAILGPSGGGKTTLLRVVLGLLRPECGTAECPLLADLAEAGLASNGNGASRSGVGYIPQNLGLVRNVSVRGNVLLGALSRLEWWRAFVGRFPRAEVERAEEALAAVGLAGRGGERIEELSGGERRRVAIARALLQRPKLLVADEFLSELDPLTAQEVTDVLDELRRTTGMTVLFVDHDVEMACRFAERVVILVDGRKVVEMDTATADPARIRELYRRHVPA